MSSHTNSFTSPPIVGVTVTGYSEGPGYRTAWSGIYVGVKPSEWDGAPHHYFRDGIIGATQQRLFAMPVDQFCDHN